MKPGVNIGLATSNPALAELVNACEMRNLSAWEREFVASVKARRKPLSDKQLAVLHRIAEGALNPAVAELVEVCERRVLSAWECEFIISLKGQKKPVTDKQIAVLRRIAEGAPDYAAINAAALRRLEDLLSRWLPEGEKLGREYGARNPRRSDRNAGSFKVNLDTGLWADFACGAEGGDPISLAAYLFDLKQPEAARRLAGMLGMEAAGA